MMNRSLNPNLSPSLPKSISVPVITTKYAVTICDASEVPILNAREMVGRETLTV